MQRYLIDIDNHILFSDIEKCKCGKNNYILKKINQEEITLINKFFDKGHEIIIWTARGWDQYDFTFNQLNSLGIKFHQLIMGKMTGIYVDKEALHSLNEA